MLIDALALFSEDKALGAVGAHASTNNLDLGVQRDPILWTDTLIPKLGCGTPVYVNILMTESAAATGGAAESTFELWDDTDDSGYALVFASVAYAKATLIAGFSLSWLLPPKGTRRYIQIVNTVTTNDFTSGKYTAWLGEAPITSF